MFRNKDFIHIGYKQTYPSKAILVSQASCRLLFFLLHGHIGTLSFFFLFLNFFLEELVFFSMTIISFSQVNPFKELDIYANSFALLFFECKNAT